MADLSRRWLARRSAADNSHRDQRQSEVANLREQAVQCGLVDNQSADRGLTVPVADDAEPFEPRCPAGVQHRAHPDLVDRRFLRLLLTHLRGLRCGDLPRELPSRRGSADPRLRRRPFAGEYDARRNGGRGHHAKVGAGVEARRHLLRAVGPSRSTSSPAGVRWGIRWSSHAARSHPRGSASSGTRWWRRSCACRGRGRAGNPVLGWSHACARDRHAS